MGSDASMVGRGIYRETRSTCREDRGNYEWIAI